MKKTSDTKDAIVIYKSTRGIVKIDVRLEGENIWLSQSQIALLFNIDRSVITKHLNSIFDSKELFKKSNVQKMHIANSDKPVNLYSLDAIISVGYRVNSKQATKFRIWATKTLKEHLLQGYTLNEKRLLAVKSRFEELQKAITFLQEKSRKSLLVGQSQEILSLLAQYARTLNLLEAYDKKKLQTPKGKSSAFRLEYADCNAVISQLKQALLEKKEASQLFGNEKDLSLAGIIGNLYQTFAGDELYPSIEAKAAHLLYFVIKDHPFSDGNKRIGSFLFVYFLDKVNILNNSLGQRSVNDNALTALALLIAESDPKEKDIMIKLIINLLSN